MGYPSVHSVDRIVDIVGFKSLATLKFTCDGGFSANDIFMEKVDGEGGVLAVYCSCWYSFLGIWIT